MKTLRICLVLVIVHLLAACRDSPILPYYQPVLPELPAQWKEIPGEPHWRIQWIGEAGNWQEMDISPGQELPRLVPSQEWTTPVIAWPFWPELSLLSGMMRPCGALFPWDGSGGKINLGWEGGVLAVFWKEMAEAERPTLASAKRVPWYFDWPRFRDLLSSENIPAAVRQDLWLPDWKSIAGRTIQSGFDRRRIVSRKFSDFPVPGIGGSWVGSSPFAASIDAGSQGPLILKVAEKPDTWVSTSGIIKCSSKGWVFISSQ